MSSRFFQILVATTTTTLTSVETPDRAAVLACSVPNPGTDKHPGEFITNNPTTYCVAARGGASEIGWSLMETPDAISTIAKLTEMSRGPALSVQRY